MATFDIASVDANLAVANAVNAPDLELHDVRKAPFQIYGLYQPQTEPVFIELVFFNSVVVQIETPTCVGLLEAFDMPSYFGQSA